jgi:hypothetical protein
VTVLDLLTESLTTAQIIGQGNPTPSDWHASQAMQCLVGLVDTSNADPLRQLTASRTAFVMQPGKQAYTIGNDPSCDIPVPRPENIQRANVIDMHAQPNPNHVPMRVLQWSEYDTWGTRNSLVSLPPAIWYDGGFDPIPNPTNPTPPPTSNPALGQGTIWIVGMPTDPNQIEFWTARPLTQATSYFDDLVFPPGYYEYFLYGVTGRLCIKFARPISAEIAALWNEARRTVESANASPAPVMQLDTGLPNAQPVYWDGRSNSYIARS